MVFAEYQRGDLSLKDCPLSLYLLTKKEELA
jgi:hypothetical protein